ncbi:MAG: ABC transporter permease [Promethearchaeota archaeon]
MRFSKYLFSSIGRYKYRYAACVLGFSAALATVFVMSAYSELLNKSVNRFFMVGSNTVLVLSEGTSVVDVVPFGSRVQESVASDVEEVLGVRAVVPLIFKEAGEVSGASRVRDVVVGIKSTHLDFLLQGAAFQEGGPPTTPEQAVIGPAFGGGTLHAGDKFQVRGENFTVAGVLAPLNPAFDSFAYCNYQVVQGAFDLEGQCTLMYVLYEPGVTSDVELAAAIDDLDLGVVAVDSEDLRESSGGFFQTLQVVQVFVGVFPVGIAVMFTFVLLTMAVREQEREFGILRALGASPGRVGLLVFFQALAITAASFALGSLFGVLSFAYAYTLFGAGDVPSIGDVLRYISFMTRIVPTSAYLNMGLASLVLGCLVGAYPSLRASRTSIVDLFRRPT